MEYYDNDFMDDDIPVDEDCEEMDIIEGDISDDADNFFDVEDTPEPSISFDDFLFWGGFLGINIDEEREERRRKKKKREPSDPEDNIKKEDDF